MRIWAPALKAFMLALFLVPTLAAQSGHIPPPAQPNDTGWTAGVEFDGSSDSDGQVYELDSSLGYKFSKHVAVGTGLPFYLVQPSGSGSSSTHAFGNPHLGLQLLFPNPALTYNSSVTGFIPTADTSRGLSTGRFTYDWNNHFDHAFSSLTPFLDAGLGNTVVDDRLFHRPFTTLGFVSHFSAGSKLDVWKFFSVMASAYDILPAGPQKMYSRLVSRSATGSGPISHGRAFERNGVTSGSADLTRDNGYSAALDANPSPYLDLELGYTHSVHYDFNTVSFSIGLNLGSLAKKGTRH
jgi:hypothetical protein